jgi:hypothetical protein
MTVAISRVVVTLCMAIAPWTYAAPAGDYRTFRLGDHPGAVARQTGLAEPNPAAGLPGGVSEMTWRPQYQRGDTGSSDPVSLLVFSFYEDQLFRIEVEYASDRTAGMVEADMVAALSRIYGPPEKRTDPPNPIGRNPRGLPDGVVAQWFDGGRRVALLVSRDRSAFRLIVAAIPLEARARAAGAHEPAEYRHDRPSATSSGPGASRRADGPTSEAIRRANLAGFVP